MVGILESLQQFLELRHQKTNATFKLQQVAIRSGEGFNGRRCQRGLEVPTREYGMIALLAKSNIKRNRVIRRWLFCGGEAFVSCHEKSV